MLIKLTTAVLSRCFSVQTRIVVGCVKARDPSLTSPLFQNTLLTRQAIFTTDTTD